MTEEELLDAVDTACILRGFLDSPGYADQIMRMFHEVRRLQADLAEARGMVREGLEMLERLQREREARDAVA